MYKFLTLISTFLFSTTIFSQVLSDNNIYENNKINLTASGYVNFTNFSDSSWYEDSNRIALNFNLLYDSYAIRTQLISGSDNRINRFTIEKNLPLFDNELLIKVGRFPRLVSFYNNLTDSPSSYDIAMIPLGVYNRRLITSQSFNAIDGISLEYTYSTPTINNSLFKFYINYGKPPIDNQCIIQQEYRYDKCIPGYEFLSDSKDYDIGASFEYNDLTFLISNSNVQFRTRLKDPKNPMSVFLVKRTNKLIANVSKIGVKYENNKYLLQGEYSFHNYSVNNLAQGTVSIHKENIYYVLGKYFWFDNFSTNLQYSHAKSAILGSYKDKSVGMSYVYKNATISLDYHVGTGVEWKKYMAIDPKWRSTVLTVSYTF